MAGPAVKISGIPTAACIVLEQKSAADVKQLISAAISGEVQSLLAASNEKGLRYVVVFAGLPSVEQLRPYVGSRLNTDEQVILYSQAQPGELESFCQHNGVAMRTTGLDEVWRTLEQQSETPDDGVNAYIETFASASNRTRYVIILMVVAWVLMFTAVWNGFPKGWINSRLAAARADLFGCRDKATKAGLDPKQECMMQDTRLSEEIKLQRENVNLIKVPFFGVAFDVDDVGVIGGFTLLILLMWLQVSLTKECECLQTLFGTKGGDTRRIYELAAMRQEIARPPMACHQVKAMKDIPWTKIFCSTPLIFQVAVIVESAWIYRSDINISKFNVIGDSIAIGIATLLMAYTTLKCWRAISDLERVWQKRAEALDIA